MLAEVERTDDPAPPVLNPFTGEAEVPRKFQSFLPGNPSRYKAAHGGRGSAKSHTIAALLVIEGYLAPHRILCAREIQNSIKESVKKLLEDKIEAMKMWTHQGGIYSKTQYGIFGTNGTVFFFLGLRTNILSIKSLEGITRVWVEEASTVSQNSIDILKNTIRAPGSELWFSWNPDKPTDPVDAMFRPANKADLPPRTIVVEANYTDNPWFPPELEEEMLWDRRRDPDKYAHTWLGEYQKNSEARVFRNWRIARILAPDRTIFRFGADWGFSIDPTVLVRGYLWAEDPRLPPRHLFIDREAWKLKLPIDDTGKFWKQSIPGCEQHAITADSSRPETIHYMKKHGFPRIQGARKGPDSVVEGITFLQSLEIVIDPGCKHVIDEFSSYSYETDKLTGEVTNILSEKKNHTIDACRYMLEGVRRQAKMRSGRVLGSI